MNNIPLTLSIKQSYLIILGILILIIILCLLFLPKNQPPVTKHNSVTTAMVTVPPVPLPTFSIAEKVPGQVIVKFKSALTQSQISGLIKKYNATILSTNTAIHTTVLQVPNGEEESVVKNLTADGLVEYAETNHVIQYRSTLNDPQLKQQWNLEKIHASQAWDISTGKGVKVAVVDGGVDKTHEDLASKIIATNSNTMKADEHGTHIAGIIAGASNNALGIAGVCPDCQLLFADGGGNDAESAAAITWAADQGAKVISMSWGSPVNSRTLQDAITYAWNKGALPVAAVPNTDTDMDTTPDYPSGMDNVISVTDTDSNDKRATAGFGKTKVWLAAPGVSIFSTLPGNKYGNETGTSMATPLVGGVAGLLFGTSLGTSPQAVRQRLCDTADKIPGTGKEFKCGRLNAFKALTGATASDGETLPILVPSFVCAGSTQGNFCPTTTPRPPTP